MYMMPDMINMGLKTGQKWKSKAHRIVAENICLCNSLVTNRDTLIDMCQKINRIPVSKIKKVTLQDLAVKYSVPNIRLS